MCVDVCVCMYVCVAVLTDTLCVFLPLSVLLSNGKLYSLILKHLTLERNSERPISHVTSLVLDVILGRR